MSVIQEPKTRPQASVAAEVQSPPKWKMATLTFVAVYPLSCLFAALIAPRLHGWDPIARSLAFPVVLVPLLTYVLMPVLTWIFRTALQPPPNRSASVTKESTS